MDILFKYVFGFAALVAIFLTVFFWDMDKKYIKKLKKFSDINGFVYPIDHKYQIGAILNFASSKDNHFDLIYKRRSELPSKYYNNSRPTSLSDSYASHWIVLKIYIPQGSAKNDLLRSLDQEISQIKWNIFELKLDASILLSDEDEGIFIHFGVPFYSVSVWKRFETILLFAISRK